ncbi:MAG TPA: hypothetical protein VK766_10865 [Cytophagaceae bacterium]|jgi:hypothetical protein|nr:hypothetical protein [Cytophagaceae bacterium]
MKKGKIFAIIIALAAATVCSLYAQRVGFSVGYHGGGGYGGYHGGFVGHPVYGGYNYRGYAARPYYGVATVPVGYVGYGYGARCGYVGYWHQWRCW